MYEPVSIANTTEFNATGKVDYPSVFCRDDNYDVGAHGQWKASSRGSCLVTRISAVLHTRSGDIWAQPYESSGTGYSNFAIVPTGKDSFMVTRLSFAENEAPPSDYAEPTEQQK